VWAVAAVACGLAGSCAASEDLQKPPNVENDASAGSGGAGGWGGSVTGGTSGAAFAGGDGGPSAGGVGGGTSTGGTGADAGASGSGALDGGADSGDGGDKIEACNGLDDDGDELVDEDDPGGGAECNVPQQQGVCRPGIHHCLGGLIHCVPNEQPSDEICDGRDNDCDGEDDEGDPGGGQQCNTTLEGVCAEGLTLCSGAQITCEQQQQSSPEVCNGEDDDCDGTPDDGFVGSGQPCTVPGFAASAPCAMGLTNCLDGGTGCTQTIFASAERCDGLDNDCDGVVDNALAGQPCTSSHPGVCAKGKSACTAGTPSCIADVQPGSRVETCNGEDDDCNGTIDDVGNATADCSGKQPNAPNVAAWQCVVGTCQIVQCAGSFKNCNLAAADGCEVDTTTSTQHCGDCNQTCTAQNGTPICSNGACGVSCNADFRDCDSDQQSCETSIKTLTNCGGCGVPCQPPNGNGNCDTGLCTTTTCAAGFGDCDGDPGTGCETNTQTTALHCSGCDKPCVAPPNGTSSCSSATCGFSCNTGFVKLASQCATFAGVWSGPGPGCSSTACYHPNPYSGGCSCPSGFTRIGPIDTLDDRSCPANIPPHGWQSLNICYAGSFTTSSDFGGAYQRLDAQCLDGNPFASGSCACPAGTQAIELPADGGCWVDTHIGFCWNSSAPLSTFGGAYLKSDNTSYGANGCVVANPATAGCSCPEGTTSLAIRSVYGPGSSLCTSAGASGSFIHVCYKP
jgi:hypothetical protein